MFKNITKKIHKQVKSLSFLMVIASLPVISACVKNIDLVGYTFKNEDLSHIKAGESTKATVKQTLGTPSVTSEYGDESWYYISTEYETIAFFKPKIKEQRIVAIKFDKEGKVADMKEYSKHDANNITLVGDKTPAEGEDVTLLNQLLGNVGRFNSDPAKPKTITKPKSAPY